MTTLQDRLDEKYRLGMETGEKRGQKRGEKKGIRKKAFGLSAGHNGS